MFLVGLIVTLGGEGGRATFWSFLANSFGSMVGWGAIIAAILAIVATASVEESRKTSLFRAVRGILWWMLIGAVGTVFAVLIGVATY
jgi:hypothetical protein